MSTYAEIQNYVKEKHHFSPKTCWIAHVKADHGQTNRVAPNRVDLDQRKHPCPPEKRAAIEQALRDLGMV
jgi:hypothetical protein